LNEKDGIERKLLDQSLKFKHPVAEMLAVVELLVVVSTATA